MYSTKQICSIAVFKKLLCEAWNATTAASKRSAEKQINNSLCMKGVGDNFRNSLHWLNSHSLYPPIALHKVQYVYLNIIAFLNFKP